MITAIELENFKGFGERQRIELAPITLLYGQNSSGKTALIHSLLFIYELFVEKSRMPHRSILGGRYVDFGSFRQLVFNGNIDQSIFIKIEMAFPWELPGFWNMHGYNTGAFDCEQEAKVDRVALELEIGWSKSEGVYHVKSYRFYAGENPVVTINFSDEDISAANRSEILRFFTTSYLGMKAAEITLHGDHPIRPSVSTLSSVANFGVTTQGVIPNQPAFIAWTETNENNKRLDEPTKRYFTGWIEGISNQLTTHLEGFACLGPLREVPVDFVPRRQTDKSRVSNGLSAWDRLRAYPETVCS